MSVTVVAQTADLKAVQSKIKQTKAELQNKELRRSEIFSALKKQEEAIAITAKALNQTQIALNQNKVERDDLTNRKIILEENIKKQQAIMAKHIKGSYVAGNYDYAKMLFNQQDAAKFERVLTYYQFLYKQRKQSIDQFRNYISELSQLEQALEAKKIELSALLTQQQKQQLALNTQRSKRELSIKELEADIQSDTAKIKQLEADEQRIAQAIEQAKTDNAAQATFAGLLPFKGALLRPAQGRLRRLFGRIRQGEVRWKGILIQGEVGSEIRAIQSGRVLFSEWLRGFGLVMIIDHGKGYMSVYGYNQALLKQPGETVSRGEPIALMGQSGGQSRPYLYFEIRRKGIPVNPTAWLSKR
ncbi:MAG: peptidoglycan DD-metalloendopeptidase family protein [Glaciecola sp.]